MQWATRFDRVTKIKRRGRSRNWINLTEDQRLRLSFV
jgi:hypothetical protein